MRLAHLTLQLCRGHQCGDRIDHDDIDRVGPDQHLSDLQCLFACVGLADEHAADINAELLRPGRVQCVFGVDERRNAAGLLGVGDHMQRQRCLAGRFGAVKLDHSPARDAASAEGNIQR